MEPRRLLANLGALGIYLVDHATRQRVASPYVGEEVEVHVSFAADGIVPGSIVRVQRETANGLLYTEMAAPKAWAGHASVERNLFTWTVPPKDAWVRVTLDPREGVAESDEGDNSATLTVTPGGTGIDLAVPAYHSLPGAAYALYLDFDGNYQAQFAGSTDVTTPVYDSDGDPRALSAGEREEVQQIWARVAEDYAPFDIDVTTEAPTPGRYTRWQRVAIGGASCDWYQFSAAGTAIMGSFADTGGASAAFVFVEQANGDGSASRYPVATVADAASHESGHTFGLMHQAQYDADGNRISEYNLGDGTWGPIMGKSGNPVSTWSNGPTGESATAYQDDMAVLAGARNGFGYRADEAGGDVLTAKALGAFVAGFLGAGGVIGTSDDVDVYAAELPAGTYTVAADVATDGPNLDAVLEVRDAGGNVIATAAPGDRQSAALDVTLGAAGTYYVSVRSTGAYGWVGQYYLSVQTALAQPGPTPVPASPGPAVDLAARLVGRPPRSATVGTAAAAEVVVVKNVGKLASTGAVRVKVFASPTREVSGDSVLLGRVVLRETVGSGKRQVVRVPVRYAKGMAGGRYYLVAKVKGAAAESSAANNVAASWSRVRVVVPTARLRAAVTPTRTVVPLKRWTATVGVRNVGTAAFNGKMAVKVVASKDRILGDEDDVLVGSARVAAALGIGSGQSIAVRARSVGEAGRYYLFAVIRPLTGHAEVAAVKRAVRVRVV